MESAVHVFLNGCLFRFVQIFYLNILFSQPVVLVRFEATDEGDVRGIQCPADQGAHVSTRLRGVI